MRSFTESLNSKKTFMFRVTEEENVYINPDPEWTEAYRIEQAFNIVFNKAVLGSLEMGASYIEEDIIKSIERSEQISKIVDTLKNSKEEGWIEIDGTEEDMDMISKYAVMEWEKSNSRFDDIQVKVKRMEDEGKEVPEIVKNYQKPDDDHYKYLEKNLVACKKILATRKVKA